MASRVDPFSCPVCMYRFTSSGEHEPIEYGCGHKIDRVCARRLFGEMNGQGTRCSKFNQESCRCPVCRNHVNRYWKDFTFASAMDFIPKVNSKKEDQVPAPRRHVAPNFIRTNRILVQPIRDRRPREQVPVRIHRERIIRNYEVERVRIANEAFHMLFSPFGAILLMIMLGL